MKYSLIANQLMRRILLLLLLFSLVATSGAAFPFSKRKKKAQSTQTEKKSAYERALTEQLTESVRGSFVSFHKTDGRILMEPEAVFGSRHDYWRNHFVSVKS